MAGGFSEVGQRGLGEPNIEHVAAGVIFLLGIALISISTILNQSQGGNYILQRWQR
jgi:hypothetical protein